ncbi:MAG: GNAT family N-acetyltransferase [Pseudomonadota bacterium]
MTTLRPFEEGDRAVMSELLLPYFEGIVARFVSVGGERLDPHEMVQKSLDDLPNATPPKGQTFMAWSGAHCVGTGCLRKISPTAGELKRMYVRPEAQGQGVGSALMAARFKLAAEMGLTDLYADTVYGNTNMLSLYARAGFTEIARYEGNANPRHFAPFLTYLHKRISG